MHATLPTGSADADRSIASMDIGEGGWMVPWGMFHDKERKLWLNGSYTIHPTPGGTVDMRVWRDENGWHVDASRSRHRHWSEGGYIGGFRPIAVTTFVV